MRHQSRADCDSPVESEFDLHKAPGHLLRRAQQLHAAVFAEVVSEAELTTPQFALLSALRSSPEIDQVRLSQLLAIDRSTIADVASRLEQRGLIRRQRDVQDGRRNLLSLTQQGRELHDRTFPEVVEVGKRLMAPLNNRDQATLLRCLTSLIAAHDSSFPDSAAVGG
jgi:DNA-binding MarR family transcriptional regulator